MATSCVMCARPSPLAMPMSIHWWLLALASYLPVNDLPSWKSWRLLSFSQVLDWSHCNRGNRNKSMHTEGVARATPSVCMDLFPNVEAKMGDIAIMHHIIFTLKPQQALLCGSSKRATGHEVLKLRDLGTNKATFDIRVNLARRFWSLGSTCDRPGSYLILSCRQESDQIQQAITNLNDAFRSQ